MNKQTVHLLEHHFDTAFAAPNGIKKLRELILALAMQGKLVAQDPQDQPASALLKEIKELTRSRETAKGKNKNKPLPEIKPEEVPYELPKGWEWVRLQECYYGLGNKNNQIQTKDYLESGDYPVVDQGKVFIAGYFNDQSKILSITKPVVVFGDHTKNIKFVDFDFVIGADGVKVLCPYEGVFSRYFYYAIKSYNLTDRGYARHFKVLNERLFPLPPLAEQHRIVAKIDQLMARCDELEKLRAEREQKRLTVHTAALMQLLEASSSSFPRRRESSPSEPLAPRLRGGDRLGHEGDISFPRARQFLARHFNELYSVKENVAELRQAILQLAVMGKLVPQDPHDKPASELLQEIEAEKKRLVKAGKIKAPKPLPEIRPEEVPYELPKGWEWVRLGDVALSCDSGWSPQCCSEGRVGREWGVLKVSAVSWGCFNPDENKALPPGMQARPVCEVKAGDFLLSRANTEDLIARSVVVSVTPPGLMMSDKIVRFKLSERVNKLFINTTNSSRYARTYYASNASGTSSSMKNVSRDVIAKLMIPLPPLAEQHRIVAKIDQLMTLCDELDKQIAVASGQQTALLKAVMAQV